MNCDNACDKTILRLENFNRSVYSYGLFQLHPYQLLFVDLTPRRFEMIIIFTSLPVKIKSIRSRSYYVQLLWFTNNDHQHQVSLSTIIYYALLIPCYTCEFKILQVILLKIEFSIILRPLHPSVVISVRLLGSLSGQLIYDDRPTTVVCLYSTHNLFVCLVFRTICLSANDLLGSACRLFGRKLTIVLANEIGTLFISWPHHLLQILCELRGTPSSLGCLARRFWSPYAMLTPRSHRASW